MSHSVSHMEQRNQKHSINLCNHERYPGHLKCLKNIQKIKYPDFQAMTIRVPKKDLKRPQDILKDILAGRKVLPSAGATQEDVPFQVPEVQAGDTSCELCYQF